MNKIEDLLRWAPLAGRSAPPWRQSASFLLNRQMTDGRRGAYEEEMLQLMISQWETSAIQAIKWCEEGVSKSVHSRERRGTERHTGGQAWLCKYSNKLSPFLPLPVNKPLPWYKVRQTVDDLYRGGGTKKWSLSHEEWKLNGVKVDR